MSSTITTVGEGGLLGLAFDPGYAQNGFFYVNLTNAADDTEIRRYQVSSGNLLAADPASRLDIITVDQPGRTHQLQGRLAGLPAGRAALCPQRDGDGGGGGSGNSQNPLSLLGKTLPLDVGADAFPGNVARNYTIPSDNPFVSMPGVAPEIWALGLRNPSGPASIAISALFTSAMLARPRSRKSISAQRAPTTAGTSSKDRRASSRARWDRAPSPTRSIPTAAALARP